MFINANAIKNAYNELAIFIIAVIICYMVADFMADVMFKKIEQLIIAKKNKDKIEEQRKIEELKQKDEEIADLHIIIKLLNEQIVNMSNNNNPNSNNDKSKAKDDKGDRLWSSIIIADELK
jgi:hypothetical protein